MIIDSSNIRLDLYLVAKLGKARSYIQKLIKEGHVLLNGKHPRPAMIINTGDSLEIEMPKEEKQIKPVPQKIPLDIIYEDNEILIINKPFGMVVHAGIAHTTNTLVNALMSYSKKLSNIGGKERAGIVHRLDRFTDGLMLIAKNNKAHINLADQFKNRQIEKKYYAVCKGNIFEDELVIDEPIGRDRLSRDKMSVRNRIIKLEKEAETKIQVLKRFNTKTLLNVIPKTGRTHQIRVHLAYIGHPILGDPLYQAKRKQGSGQLLQAYFLAFTHPKTGNIMSFEIPMTKRLLKN